MMKNKYKIVGKTTLIFAQHKGKEFKIIIDTEDLKRVKFVSWWIQNRGTDSNPKYYARCSRTVDGVKVSESLHNLIKGKPTRGHVVDHINGNSLDNRKDNLRIVTVSVNNRNRVNAKSDNTVGVSKRNNTWRAFISYMDRSIHLGTYKSKQEAVAAREGAERVIEFLEKKGG